MGKVQGIALRGGVLRLQTLVLHSVQGGGGGGQGPPPLIQGRYDALAWVEDAWADDVGRRLYVSVPGCLGCLIEARRAIRLGDLSPPCVS